MAMVADLSDPTKPTDTDLTIKPSGHLQRVTIWDYNATTGLYTPRSVLVSGSATVGAPGSLAFGAAATASPTLTNGLNYPFSFTLKGGVRSALIDVAGTELDYTSPVPTYDSLIQVSDLTPVVLNIGTATTTEIVAAVPGQTTRVHRLRINVAAANTVTIKDGSTTLHVMQFTAAEKETFGFSSRPWYITAVNSALNITTSTTGQVNGVLEYVRSI